MKKKIKLLLGIFLFVIICFLAYKITSKLNYKKEVAERVKVIPDFSFYRLDGSKFSTKNLQKKPSVFVYFNSECIYCKSETKKIQERLEDFKEVQLIFISFEKKEIIQQFAKDYEILDQEKDLFLESAEYVHDSCLTCPRVFSQTNLKLPIRRWTPRHLAPHFYATALVEKGLCY